MNLKKLIGVLKFTQKDINLRICLTGGQSFRWNESGQSNNEFIGVIHDKIVVLDQNSSSLNYTVYCNSETDECQIEKILIDYLRLDVDLLSLYDQWSKVDPIFKQKLLLHPSLHGVRVLNQDPIENLFSFICSSNNNIKRIRKMIKALSENFGSLIGHVNGEGFFTFPTLERLSEHDVETKLRALNFGYRAKFIQQAAVYLKKRFSDETDFYALRKSSYNEVLNELVKVPGIGNKIADCICLMSFGKFLAVPIDTHILSVASKTYNFVESKTNKTISKKDYQTIGKTFVSLFFLS